MITALFAASALILGGGAQDAKEQMVAEMTKGCEEFQAANGGSTDCKCLATKAAEDDELRAELFTLTTPEAVAGASDKVKAAIMSCQKKEGM